MCAHAYSTTDSVVAMIGLVALVGTGSALAAVEKSVTISPTSGFVGTVVTAKLRGAPQTTPLR